MMMTRSSSKLLCDDLLLFRNLVWKQIGSILVHAQKDSKSMEIWGTLRFDSWHLIVDDKFLLLRKLV